MIRDNANAEAILVKVRDGELSPQAAEEWATARHRPPFAGKPDPQGLDPMTEPLWTIPMALAWFIWRTKDAVVETMDDYRRNWRKWTIVQGNSSVLRDRFWDLVPVAATSIADLLRHPDINRLPTDRLFDPSISNLGQPFSVGESSPYRRFLDAVELEQIHPSAIASESGGRKTGRGPFPFLSIHLEDSLDWIREKRAPEGAARVPMPAPSDYFQHDLLDYFAIRVPRDEVLSADILASRRDFNCESWTTEYTLGWIAYREIDKFRLLSPTNIGTLATEDTERRLGVKHIYPDVELLTMLREGRLLARPSIEIMHLGDPNPIPPDWWKDRNLNDAPHLRFAKDDVTKIWTADGTAATAAVAPGIHPTQDGSITYLTSTETVSPWESSENLTAGERRVIIEAKRHWPDCKCLLRPQEVYTVILGNWDTEKLGAAPTEVTIKRALKKILMWNAWREANLGKG
jgi:hypothetical protein